MKFETNDPNDRISALVDGQLQAKELASVMADMETSPEMVSSWHVYQLIGDVMRSEDLAGGAHDLDFLTRLQAKLVLEPLSTDPVQLTQVNLPIATVGANADMFRWKWLSGVAVSALVAVVGFGVWNPSVQPQMQASMASPAVPAETQVANVQSQEPVMLRDPQLDALMAAHQQLGGHSALQMPSGFLRNATFERPSR
jgi:sigma-E factor negative regulatory protein RseA